MNASTTFHFGDRDRPLIGHFHEPMIQSAKVPAVVICNPFGEEYIRSYRVLRILAELLSEIGAAVLRFDYSNCGDSSGDCEDISFNQWINDVAIAHQELKDMSAAREVVWLGLRIGALVAVKAAQIEKPNGLVLWDPVWSGAQYFSQSIEVSRDFFRTRGAGSHEAFGFAVPERFVNELPEISEEHVFSLNIRKTQILKAIQADGEELGIHHKSLGHVEFLDDPESGAWNSDNALNSFYVPRKTLSLIVESVKRWR